MISICGSIYNSPSNIQLFIHNIFNRASSPGDIEIIVIHDSIDDSISTVAAIDSLQHEYPQVKSISITKKERVSYISKLIGFYTKYNIFPIDDIVDMQKRLTDYILGELPTLWIPPGRNHNMAVENATGDVVIVSPFDVIYDFDVSSLYKRVKEKYSNKDFCLFFSSQESFGLIPANHGMRIFNRSLFDKVMQKDIRYGDFPFSFDERFFLRPIYEDVWNDKIIPFTGNRITWKEAFGDDMIITPLKNEVKINNYLTSKELSDPENHLYYMKFIEEYWEKYNCKYG